MGEYEEGENMITIEIDSSENPILREELEEAFFSGNSWRKEYKVMEIENLVEKKDVVTTIFSLRSL